ncbi:MAG: hypothetical protein AAF579_16370 [Cyanobacteria bacterium P01_C01_bin.118]
MGLFDFLGGNKNKAPQSKEAYFLSEDEAKTFGNIDYMRKEVVIRRTFAKKKGQAEEMESVKSISASTARPVGEAVQPAASSFSAPAAFSAPAPVAVPTPVAPVPTSAPEAAAPASEAAPAPEVAAEASAPAPTPSPEQPAVTRTPDTSMDMFRNMAKNIRR